MSVHKVTDKQEKENNMYDAYKKELSKFKK